jgi:phospholipid/cholesterol/gamma-HCH transport system substrate-binding protein
METRANYLLIGAFSLAGFLGMLGFFLWFANLHLDRQFAYYDIEFDSVAGLGNASDVRFAGFPVGQVVDIGLSPDDTGQVRVRIEVDAGTPIRIDSRATIEAQGVTGVSYVGISAGTPAAPILAEVSPLEIPEVEAGQSALQSLTQDAPLIVTEALGLVQELRETFGEENQSRIRAILDNTERSSAVLSRTLEDFSRISGTVSDFAREIDRFNTTIDTLTRDASGVFTAAGTALAQVGTLTEEARGVISQGSATLARAEEAAATARDYITEELDPTTEQLRRSAAGIEERVAALGDRAEGLIDSYSGTGPAALALLGTAETTLGSVDLAARRVETLMADGAEPLVAELRMATSDATTVLRGLSDTAETDLPEIVRNVREATEITATLARKVAADLTSASGRIDGLTQSAEATLDTVRRTFDRANETLAGFDEALRTGDAALSAAEATFTGADRIVNEEAAAVADQLRTTLDELARAVGTVAGELPAVVTDLRSASQAAERSFVRIDDTVTRSARPVQEFTTAALPQYGRLAVEIRSLISSLESLVQQIQRDPSRFLLDPRAPEFTR